MPQQTFVKFSATLPKDVFNRLSQERGERSAAISRNLRRLDQIYSYELERMRERFTQEELGYLHALATPLLQDGELPHNWIAMIATSASQYQRNNLVSKLRDMTLPQRLALSDAIERAARTQTAVTL